MPDRVLRAIDRPVIDHRGPEFGELGRTCLEGLQEVFQTAGPVVIYPASGTGAWEAALVNTLSQGDAVLMARPAGSPCCGTTWRAGSGWSRSSWTPTGAAAPIRPRSAPCCKDDRSHRIKAVCVVHNETSTGCVTHVDQVRRVMDELRPSGAADGGCDFLARRDGVPPRRVARRRHHLRFAEGTDDAAGPVVQRDQRRRRWRPTGPPGCRATIGTGRRCWR